MSPSRQNPERVAQSDEWARRSGVCRHDPPWPGRRGRFGLIDDPNHEVRSVPRGS